MTATLTPPRPGTAPGHDSFARLLHAEWTKFRTVRGWVIAVIVAALVTLLLGLYTGVRSQEGCPGGPCHYTIPTGPGGEAVTDTYYFVHRPLAADGTITVRVTSLTGVIDSGLTAQGPARTQPALVPWSKAGLIITAGPGQGSAYAAVMVTGSHGTRMQWNYTGDTPGLAGGVSAASPRWLRLTRAGDVVTGYDSRRRNQLDQDRHRHPARAGGHSSGRAVRHLTAVHGDGQPAAHRRIQQRRPHRRHRHLRPHQPARRLARQLLGRHLRQRRPRLHLLPGRDHGRVPPGRRHLHRHRLRRHSTGRQRRHAARRVAGGLVHRADRGDRGRRALHDRRVPAGPDPPHARR